MKKLPMFQVDAFTDSLYQGNPAAVVIIEEEWLSEEQMQKIAFENNLSETAFVKALDEIGHYLIRWFTPTTEVPLCGHATLASAFILFKIHNKLSEILFDTLHAGQLKITRGEQDHLMMDFPNRAPTETIDQIPADLIKGLSIAPQAVLKSVQAYFVIYDSEDKVRNVIPDPSHLIHLNPMSIVVTARSTSPYDFVSRYFATNHGVGEDPVTGSIHAGLAPYWASVLGKDKLSAYQASQRGGKLTCEIRGDRVIIQGQAVLFLGGFVYI